jgi:hypothetical protein
MWEFVTIFTRASHKALSRANFIQWRFRPISWRSTSILYFNLRPDPKSGLLPVRSSTYSKVYHRHHACYNFRRNKLPSSCAEVNIRQTREGKHVLPKCPQYTYLRNMQKTRVNINYKPQWQPKITLCYKFVSHLISKRQAAKLSLSLYNPTQASSIPCYRFN